MLQNLRRSWQCALKNGMRNLGTFDPTLESLKTFTLIGTLLTEVCNVWAKKVQRSYASLYGWSIQPLKKKLLVFSEMTWGHWWSLLEHSKILKFALWETFQFKVCNVWTKKIQRSYVLWHWRVRQYLIKSWVVVWKMT